MKYNLELISHKEHRRARTLKHCKDVFLKNEPKKVIEKEQEILCFCPKSHVDVELPMF